MKGRPTNVYLMVKGRFTRLNAPRMCRYADCAEPVKGRGLCARHYSRWSKRQSRARNEARSGGRDA